MNATFVLDRSHSAIISSLSSPPSPNRSVLRVCSGVLVRCAPPRRTEPQPTGRSDFFVPHRLPFVLSLLLLKWRGRRVSPLKKMRRQIVQKPPSTDPLSGSLFHRDWRLGKVASSHIIRFSISSPLSFHEEVCDVCVVVSSSRPLASNTRDLSLSRLP